MSPLPTPLASKRSTIRFAFLPLVIALLGGCKAKESSGAKVENAQTWSPGKLTSVLGVPATAIIFQLLVSSALLLSQSFEAVLDFIQFSLTFCSFFTVLGVVKLRMTHPKLPRPYRAWGYPVTPLVFLAVMLWMMYYLVVNRPLQSLAGFAMMLSGLAIYAVSLQLSKVASSDSSQTTGSQTTGSQTTGFQTTGSQTIV